MKVKVGISNRHIHLTEDTYRLFFEKNMSKRNDLNQPNNFAANETLTIENNGKYIKDVRIVGPFRNYNQVEISSRDAKLLKINPPIRKSGDLKDAVDIIIVSQKGKFKLKNCCIIPNRHVHMNKKLADSLNLKDNQEVKFKVSNEKGGLLNAFLKISDDAFLELHIDTDDAYSLMLKNNDEVELII